MKGIHMEKVHSVIFLSFLIILLLVTPVNGSSDWVEYGRDKEGNVFSYNKVSIKHTTKDIVQVWEIMVYSDEGREKFIQYVINRGGSTKGYDKLSQQLSLVEIDCKKERTQNLSITHYDTDGNILFYRSYDKPNWNNIVPGSIIDTLRKKVCK